MSDGACCHYCRKYRCICDTGWKVIYSWNGQRISSGVFETHKEALEQLNKLSKPETNPHGYSGTLVNPKIREEQ